MSPDEIRRTNLAEQRHALTDLDADSCVTNYPGCACVACPPNRKRVIMRKINSVPWHCAAGVVGFVIGLALVAVILLAAPSHATTTPPCNTGARILCGVKPLPKHAPAKHHKPRTSGPIARV